MSQFASQTILTVQDLCFGYQDRPILKHLNFEIYTGDFVGLIGGNGTGKTTLIKLLLGLLKPDSGVIQFHADALPDHADSDRKTIQIGYVSQKAATFNSGFPATVEEVILAQLYKEVGYLRRYKTEHKNRMKEALEAVGLVGFEKRRLSQLSGGQQQRVFIARTLVTGAQLIILDEPTVGIDQKGEQVIYDLLAHLNRVHQLTMILVSHDITAVTHAANRLFCLGAEGFFEHCLDEGCHEDFYRKLYGYEVVPHIHAHLNDEMTTHIHAHHSFKEAP